MSASSVHTAAGWFRGNLHAHSFWSDGFGFPEVISEWFKSRGYHFLALTEHDRLQTGETWIACDDGQQPLVDEYIARFGEHWVQRRQGSAGRTEVRLKTLEEYRPLVEEPGRFLLVPGEEVTAPYGPATLDTTNYVNVLNLPEPVTPPACSATSAEAIGSVVAAGQHLRLQTGSKVLVSLNHPNWHWAATAADILGAADLHFMEIHTALNTCHSEGDERHPSVTRMWDQVLADRCRRGGPLLYGLASDDSHAYQRNHPLLGDWALPGRAWVMVRSAELAAESLVGAMERGDFYCSTGVMLADLRAEPGSICIAVDPSQAGPHRIRFIGARAGESDFGTVLAEHQASAATYVCRGDELYVRAEVVSDRPVANPSFAGQVEMAWTQPVSCCE